MVPAEHAVEALIEEERNGEVQRGRGATDTVFWMRRASALLGAGIPFTWVASRTPPAVCDATRTSSG